MHEDEVRTRQEHDRSYATDNKQPDQTTKTLDIIIGVFFKCCNEQLDEIEKESRPPAHEVKDENEGCTGRIVSYTWWTIVHCTISLGWNQDTEISIAILYHG